ncbi:hypothetical protein FHG87_007209 [Trinorchestia longiramus]|nr:hypothetical protein FHG87_007209 [Trinorchestia longiramus]
MNYDIPFDKTIQNVVTLQAHTSAYVDTEKEKKLVFLTRQLELLSQKQFSMNDYCFALQSYPKCNYEELRDFFVLPCKRKLQYITLLTRTSATAQHPLDNERVWFLLFDRVHLLNNCICNNRISEKGQKISLDNETTASFADVKELYESKKGSILTTTTLTQFAVNPSNLLSTPQRKTSIRMQSFFRPLSRRPG